MMLSYSDTLTRRIVMRAVAIDGLLLILLLGGCASAPPTVQPARSPVVRTALGEKARHEQQQAILEIRDQTLKQLYRLKPKARTELEQAAGYGVFEVNGLNAILAETHGRGVVFEKATGGMIYMRLARTDLQPRATVQPYRQILVFHDAQKLRQFLASGLPATVSGDPGVKVYRLNAKGVSVQADWNARYFRDADLNDAPVPPSPPSDQRQDQRS